MQISRFLPRLLLLHELQTETSRYIQVTYFIRLPLARRVFLMLNEFTDSPMKHAVEQDIRRKGDTLIGKVIIYDKVSD